MPTIFGKGMFASYWVNMAVHALIQFETFPDLDFPFPVPEKSASDPIPLKRRDSPPQQGASPVILVRLSLFFSLLAGKRAQRRVRS
jgi:hypothetical protein